MRTDRDLPAATPAERRDQIDRELAELWLSGRTLAAITERGRRLAKRRRPGPRPAAKGTPTT